MKNTWFATFAAAGLFILAGWHSRDMARVTASPVLPALPAPDTSGWIQLFDGKDLNGWKHVGPGSMEVENGLIRGHGGMGLLYWTGGKLGNCTIKVLFKMRELERQFGRFYPHPGRAAGGVDAGPLRL